MKKSLMIAVSSIGLAGVVYFAQKHNDVPLNAGAPTQDGAAAADQEEKAVVNPLPSDHGKKSKAKHSSHSSIRPGRQKQQTGHDQPSLYASREGRIRKEVSQEDLNTVIFQGQTSPAVPGANAEQPKPQPSQPPRGIDSQPVGEGDNGRWITGLSGKSAAITFQNRKTTDCADPMAFCANLQDKNAASLVGVVVKSRPDRSSIVPQPMNGDVKFGNYVQDTPAVYVD